MLRDDGENAMHFFTNPNYFFEHWRTLMQQKAEEEARTEEEVRMAEISVSILTHLWDVFFLYNQLYNNASYVGKCKFQYKIMMSKWWYPVFNVLVIA